MLDNTSNQPAKFKTKIWVEINDDAGEKYSKDSQIKFKTLMLKSSLCDYSDAYILVSRAMTVARQAGDNPNNVNKEVLFKNCASFTDYIREINSTQIDNAKGVDVVMPMYNFIEYRYNF